MVAAALTIFPTFVVLHAARLSEPGRIHVLSELLDISGQLPGPEGSIHPVAHIMFEVHGPPDVQLL